MKLNLTIKDLLTLSDKQILIISDCLGITWTEWNKDDHVFYARHAYLGKGLTHNSFSKIIEKFTGLPMIGFIREYYQMDIYTVNDNWCIQLFDLNDCANDQKSCVYENSSEELINLLFDGIKFVFEILADR